MILVITSYLGLKQTKVTLKNGRGGHACKIEGNKGIIQHDTELKIILASSPQTNKPNPRIAELFKPVNNSVEVGSATYKKEKEIQISTCGCVHSYIWGIHEGILIGYNVPFP